MARKSPITFHRTGKTLQLRIASAEDLLGATELDEAHWVATNAPVDTIHCDLTFLRLIDADGNGRITCHELTAAIGWLMRLLKDRSGLEQTSRTLCLAAINTTISEGQTIVATMGKILQRLGRSDSDSISLEQVRQVKAEMEALPVSEAGVVLPQTAEDGATRQFIVDVVNATGGAPHPSGQPGVGIQQLEAFVRAAEAQLTWYQAGLLPNGKDKTDIMPLGVATSQAYAILTAIRPKLDQYFAQCQAVALDQRFVQQMGWTEAELVGLDFDDPAVIDDVLRKAPLAKARPDGLLPLNEPINPFYQDLLEQFRTEVAAKVLGEHPAELSAGQWWQIKALFSAHKVWQEAKPPSVVVDRAPETLQKYLEGRFVEAVRSRIAESAEAALAMDNLRLVEKCLLYQAHLIDLANNFVSFPHLYDPAGRALFEMGSLVMDGRRFNLAVRVQNRQRHIELAQRSNMFVLYAEILPSDGEPYELAVPVTSGGKGKLTVHKRGVFTDRSGNEHDARIVHILDNPISLQEAIVAPFRRLGRLLTGKIESLTTEAEKKLDTKTSAAISQVTPAAQAPVPTKLSPMATGGLLMGAGVAAAAVGSAVAYIGKTIAQAGYLPIVLALLGAALLVALPTTIVAFLKLRKRDLSAILEGSGWAINARMRLTRRQRRFFSQRPAYPKGAHGTKKGLIVWLVALVVLILLAVGGYLAEYICSL